MIAHLTYVGHSTVLIEMEGVRILTDPLLRRRVGHLARYREHGRVQERWWRDVDVVLISHTHWDHLDPRSLRKMGRNVRLIAPHGTRSFLGRNGFKEVQEVAAGDEIQIGSIRIEATYADHSGFRPPFGPTTDCLGFLIHGRQSVYFAGDTDIFPEMDAIPDGLDVALMPVWGWGPTLGSGHMTPQRAAQALKLIRPKLAMPIHWGTFHPIGMGWFQPDFLSVPPKLFARHAARLAPQVDVRIVPPGQSLFSAVDGRD